MQTHRWLSSSLLLTLACQSQPAPVAAPDLELAGIPAGADTAAVRRIAGTPVATSVATEPDEEGVRMTSWKYATFEVSFDDRGQVYQILVTTPAITTSRGLRVGDDTARIRRLYGTTSMADSTHRLFGIDPLSDTNTSGMLVNTAGGRVSRIVVGSVIAIN